MLFEELCIIQIADSPDGSTARIDWRWDMLLFRFVQLLCGEMIANTTGGQLSFN